MIYDGDTGRDSRRKTMKYRRREFLKLSGIGMTSVWNKRKSRRSGIFSLKFSHKNLNPDVWIELDLSNMARNLDKIRNRTKVPVLAVIKANAYGHGLIEVGQFLDKNGIDSLMVCKLQEAVRLREAGVTCPILNFGPLHPEETGVLINLDISQSVFTDGIFTLNQNAKKFNRPAKVHIHIDTGMGRMGIPYHRALSYIEDTHSLKNIRIEGISTTLTEDTEFDRIQISRFLQLCRTAEKKGIRLGLKHARSSAGILTLSDLSLDMVRPGILLYGYYPSEKTQKEDSLSLCPVLQLKSRVASVKILRPGDSVSYHRVYRAEQKEKIAVLPAGYSDGYPSTAVKKGSVLIKEKKFPLIGAITANHLEVRLPLDSSVNLGNEAVLLGQQGKNRISANDLARWAGISTYKVLLGLNPLLSRTIL
jgi:alanine racemase